MIARESYDDLKQQMKEVWLLTQTNSLLEWDQETYCPPGGIDNRGEQMGLIARLRHERFTDPRVGDLLAACEESDLVNEPDSVESANIRELRRSYNRATRIPNELVEEETRLYSKAQHVWIEARKKSDYTIFQPLLEKVLNITLKKAELFGYDTEPYDALMDDYEPGAKAAEVEQVFVVTPARIWSSWSARSKMPRANLISVSSNSRTRFPDSGCFLKSWRRLSAMISVRDVLDEVTHPFWHRCRTGRHAHLHPLLSGRPRRRINRNYSRDGSRTIRYGTRPRTVRHAVR